MKRVAVGALFVHDADPTNLSSKGTIVEVIFAICALIGAVVLIQFFADLGALLALLIPVDKLIKRIVPNHPEFAEPAAAAEKPREIMTAPEQRRLAELLALPGHTSHERTELWALQAKINPATPDDDNAVRLTRIGYLEGKRSLSSGEKQELADLYERSAHALRGP